MFKFSSNTFCYSVYDRHKGPIERVRRATCSRVFESPALKGDKSKWF